MCVILVLSGALYYRSAQIPAASTHTLTAHITLQGTHIEAKVLYSV